MSKIDNKKIPTVLGTIIIVIIIITVGALVWKYEEIKGQDEVEVQNIVAQKKVIENGQQEITNKTQPVNQDIKNLLDNFKISSFDKWKTYRNDDIGIEMEYPSELFVDTSENKIVFDYISPNDPLQNNDGSMSFHFTITSQQKNAQQYIKEYSLENMQDFKQEQIKLNGIPASKITYINSFAGGTTHTTLVQKGLDVVVIRYSDNEQLLDTFNKMFSTIAFKE